MQNMHKTTHDGPLTGVHWPINRCRGSRARVSLSTRAGSAYRGARWETKAVVCWILTAKCRYARAVNRFYWTEPENSTDFEF